MRKLSKRAKISVTILIGILVVTGILFRSLKIINIIAGVECIIYGALIYFYPKLVGIELRRNTTELISFIMLGVFNFYFAYLNI